MTAADPIPSEPAGRDGASRAASDARLAGVLGGSLLIASAVIGLILFQAPLPFAGAGIVTSALVAASFGVFAFGIRGSGSVTARKPLGTTALATLGAWLLLRTFLWQFFTPTMTSPDFAVIAALTTLTYVDLLIQFALALIAVVQIARAGAVPRPWNKAPAWVLAAIALSTVVRMILVVAVPDVIMALLPALVTLDAVVTIGGPILLGILAIVLATRTTVPPRPEAVVVYPPSE